MIEREVIHCCSGNHLMEECLAKNIIKNAKFFKIFFAFKSDDAETW